MTEDFLFSDGIYEVIKYTGKKFFEFESHIERLKTGLEFLKINFKDADTLIDISYDLIERNSLSGAEAIAYIQITRGISNPRRHIFQNEISPTVIINVSQFSVNKYEIENGVKVISEEDIRWSRCNIKTIALLPNVLARQKAKEDNAAEAIFIHNGLIIEGAHTNFFGVFNGNLITPPLSNHILPGVTRKVILAICSQINIPFAEKNISIKDIESFEEFFIAGTTSDITPVIQFDEFIINKGKPGAVTKKDSASL